MGASKKLSYLLRHSDLPNEQGWIPLEKLILGYGYTEQSLKQIVANDEKHRYEFSDDGTKVRAIYGHSNHVHIEWAEAIPPKILYHGTAKKNLNLILHEGLKSMSRQYVHLSETVEDAIKVGKRHGEPVIIEVNSKKMAEDGCIFYPVKPCAIWLTEDIAPKYLNVSEK